MRNCRNETTRLVLVFGNSKSGWFP